MKNVYEILKGPCLTEKASLQQELNNKVVFEVARTANKIEIKDAVERMFKVKVKDVRTTSMRAKQKRVGKYLGKTQEWKKAYVTLAEGEINFVDEL